MAVYPSSMALIGLELCQKAFQTIPHVSFFNAKKQLFSDSFEQKIAIEMANADHSFWRSSDFFEHQWQTLRQKPLLVICLFSLYDPGFCQ